MSEIEAKADRVQRLIDDPDLKQAFDDVREALHICFDQTPPSDKDTLVAIRQRLQIVDSVWDNLLQALRDRAKARQQAELQPFLGDLNDRTSH